MASRRQYLDQTELAEYADITITNAAEADDQISQAEEQIDAYVGPQDSFLEYEVSGLTASATSNTLTLEDGYRNYDQDYFKDCEIEIMGGTGEGQVRTISGNTYNTGVVSVSTAWTTPPDTTSYYRIYQVGKFPRECDVKFYNRTGNPRVFKTIPINIRRAVAAQVEYLTKMGRTFFATNQGDIKSEKIGDYEYEKFDSAGSQENMIAPIAKLLLKGFKNRKGTFTVGQEYGSEYR